MLRTLLLCLLAIGLAFGGVESPSMAHEAVPFSTGMTVAVDGGHVDAAHRDHRPDDEGAPCHAVVHHHCSVGLDASVQDMATGLTLTRITMRPQDSAILHSLAQAPPLQPPSA